MKFEELAKSFSLTELPESEVELSGEVPAEAVAPYKETALANIAGKLDMPGFRKGRVPPDIALKKMGELVVLEEAVELFVRDFYPELIQVKKIDAVGRPDIRITKLAPQNPVALVVCTSVYPEVKIPKDWRTIGEKIPLEKDKEQERRGKIIEALLEQTTVAVPKIFIESELGKIISQMREDVAKLGMTFEIYLKQINKSEDAIRNEFREQAKKRAKLQLTLNKIATDEKIEADIEAVNTEMKHALEHFKDANQTLLRIHIETVLRNEKVLQLLESTEKVQS